MAEHKVVLFDLPSQGRCACWSHNPWKTRLVLNYKTIPYTTHWLEYPAIAAHHEAAGIAPNADGMAYTIPAISIDGEYTQNSRPIAAKLEKLVPAPSLHLDSPVVGKMEALGPKVLGALGPALIPRVPRDVLREESVPYFRETRKKRFGMGLDELEEKKGGEEAWEAVKGPLGEIAALLKEDGSGPYFLGKEVSYADFIFVGILQFMQCVGLDIFDRVTAMDPAFGALYGACSKWLSRDDY